MSKLPATVWVCLTIIVLGMISSLTVLSALGADTTEIRTMFNTLANVAQLVLTGLAATGGAYAAVNARKAADQTNGTLDARMQKAVERGNDQS